MEGDLHWTQEDMRALLKKRLDMVKKEDIKYLSFVNRMPRSKRSGPSREGYRHFWPTRERTIFAQNSVGLENKTSHGRFDNQYHNQFWTSGVLAVLIMGEVLEVRVTRYHSDALASSLERFSFVQQICDKTSYTTYSLPEVKKLSQLREVGLCQRFQMTEVVQFLLDPPQNFSAVHWDTIDNSLNTITWALGTGNSSSGDLRS